jgi:predicted Ser/Thr protein kinase
MTEPGMYTAGDVLAGRFRLLRLLGRGGIGNVWQAEDAQLDNEYVACKILKQDFGHDRRAKSDLKREVLLTRRLRHPHILAVYTFWENETAPFITMEYVAGRNLGDLLLDREQAWRPAELIGWARQIADALDYAHASGVLHRDVKPGNILLGRDGFIRLADFGIARMAREVQTRLTGEISFGTLMYVSPEQLMGETMDARSDQYSLAATLYELLCGHPPFHTGSIITQIQLKAPPTVPNLPDGINAVLLKGLAKNPEHRFQCCGAFCRAFEAAVNAASPEGLKQETAPPAARPGAHEDDTIQLPAPDAAMRPQRLGTVLIEAGLLAPKQLEKGLAAQQAQGGLLGQILIDMGFVEEEDVIATVAGQLGIPVVEPDRMETDAGLARTLDRAVAVDRLCLPLRRNGDGELILAMADPLDLTTLNEIEATYGCVVRPAVARTGALLDAINVIYAAK